MRTPPFLGLLDPLCGGLYAVSILCVVENCEGMVCCPYQPIFINIASLMGINQGASW